MILGQRLLENLFFTGSVQQFLIYPSPAPAYEVCTQFMPDCDTPLRNLKEVEEIVEVC